MTVLQKLEESVFYEIGKRYEITINPNDGGQYFGNIRRLELFVTLIHKRLVNAFDNIGVEYKLWIELSEVRAINKEAFEKSSSGSRLHLHGYINFPNNVVLGNYLFKGQYKLSRHSDVQVNLYREGWLNYCTKQRVVMKALAKHYKVPLKLTHGMAKIVR